MKKTTYIIAALLGMLVSVRAANIVCIGLNDYTDYKSLTHAENDASKMAELFKKQGHETVLITRENATRANILKALESNPEIVYFSGHGEKEQIVLRDGQLNLDDIAGKMEMMLLDCCYVGGGLKDAGQTKVLAAAQHEAFESDGHGLFTKYLIEWVGKGRDVADSGMTAFINSKVVGETGGWQRPVLGYR